MNKDITTTFSKMVAKSKNKVVTCSTPEQRPHSPSSESLCDSEADSPVPFLCTQDGAEGETDVVWNFYTPKSEHAQSSRIKNSTPLSRKGRKLLKASLIEKPIAKRRQIKPTQKTTELFQDLIELNQNLHELIAKKSQTNDFSEKPQSGSEDDIFNDSGECSPKSGPRTNSRCLRRNVLSSKFKPETETALESDDSMNECLIKASQVVEENIFNNEPTAAKRLCYGNEVKTAKSFKSSFKLKMDQDSMDAILDSIKFDSPIVKRTKKVDSPCLNNDSFDNFVGDLNDSVLERLTQMPVNNQSSNRSKPNISNVDWTVQELVVHDGCPTSKTLFGRHNSMPESPSLAEANKPSTSGMVFGRYNSMPHNKNDDNSTGESPIRCTPEEIKKKRQQAREKLMAKRQLPFTSQRPSQLTQSTQQAMLKKPQFQPRVASRQNTAQTILKSTSKDIPQKTSNKEVDLKSLIERKRQEALMRLRRKQHTKP